MAFVENYMRGIQQKRWPIEIMGRYPERMMQLGKFRHTLLIRPKQWEEFKGRKSYYIIRLNHEIAGLDLLQSCNRATIYCGNDDFDYAEADIRFGWAGTEQYPLRLTARSKITDNLYVCWGTGVEFQRFSNRHNMIKGGVQK